MNNPKDKIKKKKYKVYLIWKDKHAPLCLCIIYSSQDTEAT